MRVGIFSDVHGNLEALEQVLRTLKAEHCDEIVFLGDAVGYGPQPDECVAAIAEVASLAILGNHDDAVLGRTNPFFFNDLALRAVLWTGRVITQETRAGLGRYELVGRRDGIFFVHATPVNPPAWEYLHDITDTERNFAAFTERICFIGHSHTPGGFASGAEGGFYPLPGHGRITLNPRNRYIINVGSVGQPRDGDPRACFALYDQQTGIVEFHRVEYDVQKTQQLMRTRRLPEMLALRLQFGH
ncbi:MAG TPA: metallophosphoesterase family protein [bacterium]|nr:metallophosphoesterase family protein [bacterium]HOC25378.1 metallophosphoesterase family protein [bacterium]HOY44724.1 metallophosphoesterase family protein [bacterium]HPG82005.1 metallophosphoesterase family protein [bacterium]HPM59505.1 metallophosphoesterase family protein [bacterium]